MGMPGATSRRCQGEVAEMVPMDIAAIASYIGTRTGKASWPALLRNVRGTSLMPRWGAATIAGSTRGCVGILVTTRGVHDIGSHVVDVVLPTVP